jgi:hypothetical protein
MKMEKQDLLIVFQKGGKGQGEKDNDGRGEFSYIVQTLVNAAVYPQHGNNKKRSEKLLKRKSVLVVLGPQSLDEAIYIGKFGSFCSIY